MFEIAEGEFSLEWEPEPEDVPPPPYVPSPPRTPPVYSRCVVDLPESTEEDQPSAIICYSGFASQFDAYEDDADDEDKTGQDCKIKWLDKIPSPEVGETISEFAERNSFLVVRFLTDYFLRERHYWSPDGGEVPVKRTTMLWHEHVREEIKKQLGLAEGLEGEMEMERLFGSRTDKKINHVSATNLLPFTVMTRLALDWKYEKKDPLLAKLFEQSFYRTAEFYEGVQLVAQIRPRTKWINFKYKPPPMPTVDQPNLPPRLKDGVRTRRIKNFRLKIEEERRNYESLIFRGLYEIIEKYERGEDVGLSR